jgi:hypothetical protein
VVCDEDRIDHLVNFYSKSNRLSISIFTGGEATEELEPLLLTSLLSGKGGGV